MHSAHQIQEACKSLVCDLGGSVVPTKMTKDCIVVLHQKEAKKDVLGRYREDQKVINFRYITECYFQMLRLKISGDFLITPK
jgi:hypothetical protein